MEFSKITIITGHYGSGKTNIAVNFALDLAAQGKKCTVVDLDIVNPYFRTADFAELFAANNINLVAPLYANSNLDIPALNFDMSSIAKESDYIILDVGGDDAGAIALGRYNAILSEYDDLQMYYVVNHYRYLTWESDEALQLMRDIELASGLKCTAIINNSNLGAETTADDVEKTLPYAEKIAADASLPLLCTTAKKELLSEKVNNPYPVKIFVKTMWN